MSIIEGIGDDVTILLSVVIVIITLGLAWISTHVREPFLEIFIIDGSRIGNLIQRLQDRTNGRAPNAADQNTDNASDSNETANEIRTEGNESVDNVSNTANNTENETANTQNTESNLESDHSNTENNTTAEISSEPASEIQASEHNEPQDSVEVPTSQNELRQRRLNFFKSDITSSSVDQVPVNETLQSGSTESAPSLVETQNEATGTQEANEETVDAEELPDGHIRVRIKYLDDRQKLVHASPDDTVGQFKRRYFAAEMAENFIVRFIFNGQELRQDATLQSYNVRDNSVIHCLLSSQNNQSPRSEEQEQMELDIGRWMFPLFGLILAIVWYYRVAYRNYFNAQTTLSLIGITFFYVTTLLASFRNQEEGDHR